MINRVFVLAVAMLLLGSLAASAAEQDPLKPRVPAGELEKVKAMKNPVPADEATIAKGKEIYEGKGACVACHGEEGRGDGPGAFGLDPSPRNFHNKAWRDARTDGELFWVIKNGSPGTAMPPHQGILTDEEIWMVIRYESTFAGKP